MNTMIKIPYNFSPRRYQLPLWRYFEKGGSSDEKRAILIWHRRAGKDLTCLNILIKEAIVKPHNYWFILPSYKQVRKAIWEGKRKDGTKYLDCIPTQLIKRKNEQDMSIELANGSIIRFLGGDNPDSLVGAGPRGIVFSEWALMRPSLWDLLEPILSENHGWALFNSTPRGDNHCRATFETFKKSPDYFASILTVNDTGIVPKEEIDKKRYRDNIPEEIIQQEYFCSFAGARTGSYYGDAMNALSLQGRICKVPYDPQSLVHTYWDLGLSDETAIWFVQYNNTDVRVIDYYEDHNRRLGDYADYLLRVKPYRYGSHNLPHDGKKRELGTLQTYQQMLLDAGLSNVRTIQRTPSVHEGILQARQLLTRCWFDEEKCKDGLYCLRNYHREYDADRKCFRDRPEHDGTSHGADAFRMIAESLAMEEAMRADRPVKVEMEYDFMR